MRSSKFLSKAKKTAATAALAAEKKVDASVVNSSELPETSVHDMVTEMESPKSNKGKIASPSDLVQEMHGSVKNRLAPANLLSISSIEMDKVQVPLDRVNVCCDDDSSMPLALRFLVSRDQRPIR